MPPQLEQGSRAGGPVVQGFRGSNFVVDGQAYQGLWLTPRAAGAWTGPALDALELASLDPLLSLEPAPEFILLGTGPAMRAAPRALRQALDEHGIGLEAMDSRAAARAWAMLRGEGRWLAALLLPLGA